MATRHKGLGDLLRSDGVITDDQLRDALEEQSRTKERLGSILCKRGYLEEPDLIRALGRQLGLEIFDPSKHTLEPRALERVSVEFAQRHDLLPLRVSNGRFTVVMSDPLDVVGLDHLRRLVGGNVEILLSSPSTLKELREKHYSRIEDSRSVQEAVAQAVVELGSADEDEELDEEEAKRRAQDAPIVKLVEQMIVQALRERATDIHVEPQERDLIIRYRVDGLLFEALKPPLAVHMGLTSRVKILANMDIAERRTSQDGRFTVRSGGREVDVRVSVIPTIHGEKLVLRLLDKHGFDYSIKKLGFSERDYEILLEAIRQPYGMILLSGPTGSGKTTTLYSSLLELRTDALNFTTVEDPVEYHIRGVNQVQVNRKKGMTFVQALRSFLRQDPDVIMVGEVRDGETAELAVRAALTGHLVFSTIHANDAPSTAIRLLSMDVEPFQAASALTLVAAQRLVRKNCTNCSAEDRPSEERLFLFKEYMESQEISSPRFLRGAGCAECGGRGYKGRVAIVEMMPMTAELRQLVAEHRPADEIRRAARAKGMKTLRESGFDKAAQGITTIDEVMRVCLADA